MPVRYLSAGVILASPGLSGGPISSLSVVTNGTASAASTSNTRLIRIFRVWTSASVTTGTSSKLMPVRGFASSVTSSTTHAAQLRRFVGIVATRVFVDVLSNTSAKIRCKYIFKTNSASESVLSAEDITRIGRRHAVSMPYTSITLRA